MTNIKNSKLGFGTAAIGRPLYINIKKEKAASDISKDIFISSGIKMLDAAYDKGIRYFDTAPGYGIAEQMLIDWVAEKVDDTVEVATKWGYTYIADFDPNAVQHEVKEHSIIKLDEQWSKSKNLLPRLKTYQIHSATIETGVLHNERILHRLAELQDEYKLLIGITTTGKNQLEVLKKALDVEVDGKEIFDAFQVTYNIFDQSLTSIVKDVALRKKRLIIKEALANGRIFPNIKYPHYSKAYQHLNQLSQKYNVGVDAIGLRFCMDSIPVFKVLSGAANQDHLSGNMKVVDFTLDDEDINLLKELSIEPSEYWNERKQLVWN